MQKRRTLQALVDQLAALAARQPVLALYEDVHWIDPSTLELLGLVIERLAPAGPGADHLSAGFQPPWTGQPHVTALTLVSRLGRRQGAAMVARVRDKPLPARSLSRSWPDRRRAAVRRGADQDGARIGPAHRRRRPLGAVRSAAAARDPSTLHDSLIARLDRLAPVKEIAQIGAAIGREFSHGLLAAVRRSSEAELKTPSTSWSRRSWSFAAVPRPTPPTVQAALVQDAAYQSLLKSRRQHLHARIAQVMGPSSRTVEAQPELLAQRYSGAGITDKRSSTWEKAGTRHSGLG